MALSVAIVVYPGFQLLDACGPITCFEIAGRTGGGYALRLASLGGGAVPSSAGISLETCAIAELGAVDTLIVAGGEGSRAAMADCALRDALRRLAADAGRVCSVCSGALVLAAAGLLDGCRATTHWRRVAQLARQFPAVRVEPDRIFIRDGRVWTSAGISAGIDLALALITDDLGEACARGVAQDMVVYYRRPGGQSQFSALADTGGGETPFAPLLGWIREHLAERLTVERLAEKAGMSPRNFSRAFARATGTSPARTVERIRLEVARARVEQACAPVEVIARETGFNDPERMRRAFLRAFGQPPQAMRRMARLG